MTVQLVIERGLPTSKKMKGQLVHSPTRIDSLILPWSSKLFWGSSPQPLFNLERVQ